MAATTKNQIAALRRIFDFPDEKPEVGPNDFGWFADANRKQLPKVIPADARVIVELGSLFGTSARFFADHAPNATVICIDHWQGGAYLRGDFWTPLLPILYETFLASCWKYRERIVPVRMHSTDGMNLVAEVFGLRADLVYVDAGHHYAAVKADIETAMKLWPEAVLCGDDWTHPEDDGVERAVMELLPEAGYQVEVRDPFWWAKPEARERPEHPSMPNT